MGLHDRWELTLSVAFNEETMADGRVRVGIIGSQFQADIQAASFQIMPHEAGVVSVRKKLNVTKRAARLHKLSGRPERRHRTFIRTTGAETS